VREERSVGTFSRAGIQDMRARGKLAGRIGEVFKKLSVKRVEPAHDDRGDERLDQAAEFRFKHARALD